MKSICFLIVVFAAVAIQIRSQRTEPFTAEEYVKSLGFGFDTDIFKASPPLRNYNNRNNRVTDDLNKLGVGHLRLRSRADVFGYKTRTFDSNSMKEYLDSLEVVLKDMIGAGIFPIISWINHEAESKPTTADGTNYVNWWKLVAERTKNYTYELSFNLFTEINDGPLRQPSIYNDWTERAVNAIRSTGGNNKERIIILGAPGKKADSLFIIKQSIYENSKRFAAEWHLYASGPDKDGGQKNWAGNGSLSDKANVDSVMDEAVAFTNSKKLPTWIGAWMPYDNIGASQNQQEVEAFACYFATAAFKREIPWAMNKLDNFYDTEQNKLILSENIGRNSKKTTLNISRVLESSLCAIKSNFNNQSAICSSTCLNQNCLGSSIQGRAFLRSCLCTECTRPCTRSGAAPCLYPFKSCLKIADKDTCIVRDENGNGQWEECTNVECQDRLSAVPLSPQDIKSLMTQANV